MDSREYANGYDRAERLDPFDLVDGVSDSPHANWLKVCIRQNGPRSPKWADQYSFGTILWCLPLFARRIILLVATIGMLVATNLLFAKGFFFGPADWVIATSGAMLLLLVGFGHFSWLIWMIGFLGWRSRPVEVFSPNQAIDSRTALVMPIFHEDIARVAAGIRQTWTSAQKAGLAAHCDYFVLSDSVTPEVRKAEETAVESLLPLFSNNLGNSGRLFLVRREDRVNFKAGNIGNFVQKHGKAYDFMLVLDADSVMMGPCIRRLIHKLERQPGTAVIQSLVSTFRGSTPFAQAMASEISGGAPATF